MTKTKKRKVPTPDGSFEDSDGDEPTLAEVVSLLKRQNKKLDHLQKSSDENGTELQKLHELVTDNLKQLEVVKADTAKLKTDIVTVNADVHELRQELLTNNIMVSGAGMKIDRERSMMENFKEITSLLKYNLMDSDVSDVFMVKRRSGPVLIVKLVNTTTKTRLMDTLREQAKLVGQEGIPGELKSIFFSDHLTSYYENVYYLARMLKKKANLHRVWTKMGKIYLRETETGSQIRIRVLENLKDLYSKHGLEI